MKHLTVFAFALFVTMILSCNDAQKENETEAAGGSGNKSNVSLTRRNVKKEPIASHQEKTDNPLNDWYFKVQLYETPVTFHYLMKLQFEEITGEDTLRIPNLGFEPRPEIRKGDEKYSCIIGFIDNKDQFREYKKVHVKDNSLKVTTLKHYAVTTR